jgi:REP element-mobilizing transposase RayT
VINPWKSKDLAGRRRNLPHLQTPQATYFVTFRCRGRIDLPGSARDIVLFAIRHWDGQRIELDAAVVMPDHVDAIFRVIDGSDLSVVLQSIKSFSATAVNRLLRRGGNLWVEESFDDIIRHRQEWEEKMAYLRNNPVKRGLVKNWMDYALAALIILVAAQTNHGWKPVLRENEATGGGRGTRNP